jgi:type IX secretion system PorP/SprF family membrane protein
MFNRLAFNPAYAGMEEKLSVTGVFRRQWVDFEGGPSSQHINLHAPLPFLNSGFGLSLENDALGFEKNLSIVGAYNYRLYLGAGTLSIGGGGGIIQKTLDGASLRTPSGDYLDGGIIDHRDGLLPLESVLASTPVVEAGLYYKHRVLEVGVSMRNILEQPFVFSTVNILPIRSYFFTATAHVEGRGAVSFHPSILLKSDILQTQLDFSALMRYNDNIYFGASFRGYSQSSMDALAIIGGLRLSEKLYILYSYDLTLSGLRSVNSGTHEILLNYSINNPFGKSRPPQIIHSPRFLD